MQEYRPLKGDLVGNWDKLVHLTNEVLRAEDPTGSDTDLHLSLLDSLKRDIVTEDGTILLGHYRAPAAKGNHHAFEGGLTYHLLEMWECYSAMKGYWADRLLLEEFITESRILKAILYHDIHKAYRTFRLLDPNWSCDYYNDHTDQLMGWDVKSLWIITRVGIHPDPQQINALLNAEGGYSKISTRWVSSLSKLCYCLDELSGNVIGRIDSRTVLNHRTAEPLK